MGAGTLSGRWVIVYRGDREPLRQRGRHAGRHGLVARQCSSHDVHVPEPGQAAPESLEPVLP